MAQRNRRKPEVMARCAARDTSFEEHLPRSSAKALGPLDGLHLVFEGLAEKGGLPLLSKALKTLSLFGRPARSGEATSTTHDDAVKQLRKSSDITKYKNLTSTAPATQGADAHDSTGIARTITDPEMAATIVMREENAFENAPDQSRPLLGCAAVEKRHSPVTPSSPEQAWCARQEGHEGHCVVTFGDVHSYSVSPADPSTNEFLGQGSHQLRILACAQLSLGARAFHYQSLRMLAPPADVVDYWCKQPAEFANESTQAWKNASIPMGPDGCYSRCTVYRFPYSHGVASNSGPETTAMVLWPGFFNRSRYEFPCHEWDYDVSPGVLTALNEWDLVCSNAWMVIAARIYTYVGGVVYTPFLGKMADNVSRRPVLLACAVVTVVAAALTVFALTFLQLVLLRMLVAVFLCGFAIVSVVLLFEVTCEARRTDYVCYVIVAYVICSWVPCLISAAALVLDRRTLAFAFLVPVSLLPTSFQAVRESSRGSLVIGDVSDFVEHHYTMAAQSGRRSVADLDRTVTRRLQETTAIAGALTPEGPHATEGSLQHGSTTSGMVVLPGPVARTASLAGLFLSLFVVLNEASRCGEPQGAQACRGAQRFLSWQTAVLVVPRVFSALLAVRF
ncbi:hypothetical protein HPB51_011871 [Rhipicephalus microplus]|uniref:Uncharacterized protein n=1 Tax=Rhipicephalus microplus TaxID=6941 RepID=A0A9J6E8D2_RHIMP|nr:hypothetical protein HPB51_011871 [Rhipicephalus microplus]